jgi:NAD(P)-dependent dehydrogenase (short-subunit alcohol dehydrogenase family)
MDLELKGRAVVVTGGARGIGAAIVEAFAAEGSRVAFIDREDADARALEGRLNAGGGGGMVRYVHADLAEAAAVRGAFDEILAAFGAIDVLVNNAGGNDAVGLRHSPQEFEASLRRNLVHYFTCAACALDALRRSRGCIVNISSKAAVTGQGGTSGYVAAKGAINALTREWAVDQAAHGVRVNCVVPAEVITPMYERWLAAAPDPALARRQLDGSIPLGRRTTTAREVADTVVFLASARSSHTTGQILFVDGGYVHLDRAYTSGASHLKKTE